MCGGVGGKEGSALVCDVGRGGEREGRAVSCMCLRVTV